MGRGVFSFKRFTVRQERCAMKVGTDGVLLGAWAPVENAPRRVLDIGTGTGVIALIAAQRTETAGSLVEAVEIDPESAAQAAENVAASPWSERVKVVCDSLQNFASEAGRRGSYDLILSNPPYFDSSLLPPDGRRTVARHNASLPFGQLAEGCAALLAGEGVAAVILPPAEGSKFLTEAARCGLRARHITEVCPVEGEAPKRLLMELVHETATAGAPRRDRLDIESAARGEYTQEYRELLRDFYLKF